MIKELITLAKMLFKTKPQDVYALEAIEMKHFPFSGYQYMMWCGKLIFRKEYGCEDIHSESFKESYHHEYIHLMQAKRAGSWAKYYLQYLWEWIKGGGLFGSAHAYYTSPFEMEAYANEHNTSYAPSMDITKDNYKCPAFMKYYIKRWKKRRDMWVECGGASYYWKKMLKNYGEDSNAQ